MNKKEAGNIGAQEVISLVSCPHCGSQLMSLPQNFPLYNVYCAGCIFRAQIKTSNRRPSSGAEGAGWKILDGSLRAGQTVPPLITNHKWPDKSGAHQAIHFYPFLTRKNLKMRTANIKSKNRVHAMFDYINLDKAPRVLLYGTEK